jgi:hypothetical protein
MHQQMALRYTKFDVGTLKQVISHACASRPKDIRKLAEGRSDKAFLVTLEDDRQSPELKYAIPIVCD